ncbi:tRNA (adenosine(37)-N6)-dimethylallyltransferase MiaA [uncultured Enterococcus sp.]|uniref:tRNA (adenosine(37)-N6)-dimethylallyltransferase MiaA n=1 Tax=uncultured Enterococcus sp. TaxID=167972 RepID=UPI0026277C0B|nr:tRNA (adenosine(37)-N6)-dimethylallyltransferase MiaA [uncultured Enterococcus sp.]
MEKIIVIAGPTAVGKTALSIELAQKFHGEIINGDSMQVYKGLDIGTAKVTKEEMSGIVHHLLDIKTVAEGFNVAEFKQLAKQKIIEITARGHLPIIVGGTGLYLQALLEDYQLGVQEETDGVIRQKYQEYAEEFGSQALWQKLAQVDSLAAEKIDYRNVRKVIRALEVYELSQQSIFEQADHQEIYDTFGVCLNTDRALLYERINQRVELMMQAGLEEEAQFILAYPESQAAKGIGYKEFLPYFEGNATLDDVVAAIQQNSRRYAKRQLTWFRNRMNLKWMDLVLYPENIAKLEKEVAEWLTKEV